MNKAAKAASWSFLGLVGVVVLVEAAAAWVSVQVMRAMEEAEGEE